MEKNADQAVTDQETDDILDLELLADNAAGGVDGLRELLDMYLEQADQMMGEIEAAINAGKASQVDQLAHRLAGSSAVCGAAAVTKYLRNLEQCGKNNDLALAQKIYQKTVALLEQTRQHLNEYMAKL